uniref:PulJ/GspJ family protein n=1 Tax=Pseudomonas sp. RW407 TaxID=2202894 RepID=UPI002113FD27|nr:prepilin-type N-terminal cleavage/methylation domain-containing protein [Pseudomonas sp. RW407]
MPAGVRRVKRGRQAGFTLLEAVVALTLLAVVGSALLAWLGTGFRTLERMNDVQRRLDATRTGLAYLEGLNPMLQPSGSVTLGSYRLDWESHLLAAPRPVVSRYNGHPGPFDSALYRVQARVLGEDLPPLPVSLELAGYRLARPADGDQGSEP